MNIEKLKEKLKKDIKNRILHPCIHAEGNGGSMYKCKLTGSVCSQQYYCDHDKYWRQINNITCKNFTQK